MKILLASISLLICINSISQEQTNTSFKDDLSLSGGISIDSKSFGRYGLIYRRGINESWKLKASLYYDYNSSKPVSNNVPIFSSDSLIILSTSSIVNNRYTTKFGFDYNVFKFLRIGIDLNIGYSTREIVNRDKGLIYDTNYQQWQTCVECVYEHYDDATSYNPPNPSYMGSPNYLRGSTSNYLVYGMSANLGVDYPLAENWEISLQYSPEIARYQSVNNGFSFTKFHHYTDLFLRFKF